MRKLKPVIIILDNDQEIEEIENWIRYKSIIK